LYIGVYTHARRRSVVAAATNAGNVANAAAAAVVDAAVSGRGARKAKSDAKKLASSTEEAAKKQEEEAKRVRRVNLNFPPLPLSDSHRIARALAQVSALMTLAAREIACADASETVAKVQRSVLDGGGGGAGNGGSEDDSEDDSTDRSPLREGQFRGRRNRSDSTDSDSGGAAGSGGGGSSVGGGGGGVRNTGGAGVTVRGTVKKTKLRSIAEEPESDENATVASTNGSSTRTSGDKHTLLSNKPSVVSHRQEPEQQRHFGTERYALAPVS
jgi:hypothetical protein